MQKHTITSVDEYINQFPEATQKKLIQLRSIITSTCPQAQEKLSWGAPTYYLNGYLLQFAAYQHHIGFYTSPEVLNAFKEALSTYNTNEKNTMQIPLDQELPKTLIKDMILAQVKQNNN